MTAPSQEVSMKRFPHLFLLFVTLCTLLAACAGSTTSSNTSTPATSPITLNAFAAASLMESFNEVAAAYQQLHQDITVKPNFYVSQRLPQQITLFPYTTLFRSRPG